MSEWIDEKRVLELCKIIRLRHADPKPGPYFEANAPMGIMGREAVSTLFWVACDLLGEVHSLRTQVTADGTKTFLALAAEMARARAKHPGNKRMFEALGEEVGEVAKAILEDDFAHARVEAIQVACVALRLVEEGDASWPVLGV